MEIKRQTNKNILFHHKSLKRPTFTRFFNINDINNQPFTDEPLRWMKRELESVETKRERKQRDLESERAQARE